MMKRLFLAILILPFCSSSQEHSTIGEEIDRSSIREQRKGKVFPVFQIVTFPNDPCVGSSRNGTCYTSEECSAHGGSSESSCANGFGVCCIFQRTCGAMSSENCTYFTAPSTFPTDEACTLTICPCNNNICQLRLDFNSFIISGPSTDTTTVGKALYGIPSEGTSAVRFNLVGRCLTDTFSVTNPGGNAPPTICGTNTGQHMIVDSSDQCNDLTFNLFDAATGTTLATRAFDIKITQYACNFNNLAPQGCTQWFFGSTTGQVQTYNFNNQHLADQQQNICVRREQGLCRICWVATGALDFGTSGAFNRGSNGPARCCGYGNGGFDTFGFDCAVIPGAEKRSNGAAVNSRLCGKNVGLISADGLTAVTICSTDTTFMASFISDAIETLEESSAPNVGFRLAYVMDSTNCI